LQAALANIILRAAGSPCLPWIVITTEVIPHAMPPLDIHDMPGHLIRRLQQIAVAVFVDQTEGFGVSPVQYSILVAVEARPGLDQRRLAQLVAIDRSTIGDLVERLERRGLLRRTTGRRDRRTKLLYPTELGSTTLRQMRPCVDRVQQEILAFLTPEERSAFIMLLAKLVGRSPGTPVRPAPGPQAAAAVRDGRPTIADGAVSEPPSAGMGPLVRERRAALPSPML
jgi:DNA-binding MarR family transcriptional regulator